MKEALLSVTMTSLVNGDYSDPEIMSILDRLVAEDDGNVGYNTVTCEFENLLESGIIESGMSARTCFNNAFSIAKTLTNVSCNITYTQSIF
jgi:chaperonin GroEL (HSP60 family)